MAAVARSEKRKNAWRILALLWLGGTGTAAFGQYAVDIDLTQQKAYLLYGQRAILEAPVSTGRPGHSTPTGRFRVTDKDPNHTSSIYGRIVDRYGRTVVLDADVDMRRAPGTRFVNAPMRLFMQFAPGIGMHAGYLPGYAASHGCVRLPDDKALAFYRAVSVGTPVTVYGSAPRVRPYEARSDRRAPDTWGPPPGRWGHAYGYRPSDFPPPPAAFFGW